MRQQAVVKDVPFYTAIKMTGRTTFGRFDSSKNHCLAPWGIGLRVVIIFAPALPDGTLATRAGWINSEAFFRKSHANTLIPRTIPRNQIS